MIKFLPERYSAVLEIGCGTGKFIGHLKEKASECWGIEQNKLSADEASVIADKMLIGFYQDVQEEVPNEHFDLIVCNDVLEHIENHEWFLKSLLTKLNDKGTLVLSVPNVRFLPNLFEILIQKDWRYRDAGILDQTHLRFFTKKSLSRTLQNAGWQIETIQGINRYGNNPLSPKRIVSYIGQILLGRDTAFLQFAVKAKKLTNTPVKNV